MNQTFDTFFYESNNEQKILKIIILKSIFLRRRCLNLQFSLAPPCVSYFNTAPRAHYHLRQWKRIGIVSSRKYHIFVDLLHNVTVFYCRIIFNITALRCNYLSVTFFGNCLLINSKSRQNRNSLDTKLRETTIWNSDFGAMDDRAGLVAHRTLCLIENWWIIEQCILSSSRCLFNNQAIYLLLSLDARKLKNWRSHCFLYILCRFTLSSLPLNIWFLPNWKFSTCEFNKFICRDVKRRRKSAKECESHFESLNFSLFCVTGEKIQVRKTLPKRHATMDK